MSDVSNSKAKQKCAIEKPKLDNPRQLRGIFFIEHEDEDFENIMKNARKKLEIPLQAAMPCKTPINSGGETYCGIGKSKTKHWKELLVGIMRIILQRKPINLISRIYLVHTFIPMPQA